MAWSGGLASIRLPFDATGDDGRNYIDIGEEVPPELSDHFTAGLFFRSGVPPSYPNGFDYWAIGITNLGTFEIVTRYYSYASPLADPVFTRQSVLTFTPPITAGNSPVVNIGKTSAGSYNESSVIVSVADQVLPTLLPLYTPTFAPYPAGATPDVTYKSASYRKRADGTVVVYGMVLSTTAGSWGFGAPIGSLPVGCRPGTRYTFDLLGFNNRIWRADVRPNGDITYESAVSTDIAFATNQYMSLSGIEFLAEG